MEGELVLRMQRFQAIDELSPEYLLEHINRQEELLLRLDPPGVVRRQTARWNHTVNVRMMLGYRLLKSNTQTFVCRPVRGSRTWPPCCAAWTRESSPRTVGATILCRSSSVR